MRSWVVRQLLWQLLLEPSLMCLSLACACRTLYEKLGGEAAVQAAVTSFYDKLLADPLLAHFFEGVDMRRLAMKQVCIGLLTWGLGRSLYLR
jgi:hypothetical protein